MTDQEFAAITQAKADGAEIEEQSKRGPDRRWKPFTGPWDCWSYNYRITPKPSRPREWWENDYRGGGGYPARYGSAKAAQDYAGPRCIGQVHVREVLPGADDVIRALLEIRRYVDCRCSQYGLEIQANMKATANAAEILLPEEASDE